VVVLAALVHPPLVVALSLPLGAMLAVTAAAVFRLLRRSSSEVPAGGSGVALRNPFSLLAAARFGLLFAVVLLAVTIVQQRFPAGGIVVAVLANTLVKCAISAGRGAARLRRSGLVLTVVLALVALVALVA
jgi:uncharacterized membrane protein (DUF4010 family)